MKVKFFPFYIISFFPMPVLYVLSDLSFMILFYLIKYRRSVVKDNLVKSFADKSKQEITMLERKFYKHFCDVIFETLKGLTISKKQINKRIRIKNMDFFERCYHEQKSILFYAAHQGNWEWLSFLTLYVPFKVITLYKPLSNKYFDELMKTIRERPGTMCIESKKGYRKILESMKSNQLIVSAIIGDQSPAREGAKCWLNFLNQKTAFIIGAERIIERTNQVVVFPSFKRIRRGYYEIEIKEINVHYGNAECYRLVEQYSIVLEKTIKESPDMWLWSHRRWKLSYPAYS